MILKWIKYGFNMSTQAIKNIHDVGIQNGRNRSSDDCIHKYTTPLFPVNHVGGCILNCFEWSHPYLVLPIWRRKNILAIWWLRFSTFVMIYSTAMSLVWYENTQSTLLQKLIHSGGLVTFWFGTFTMLLAQLWVLLVMNTQRWMVRCYEDSPIS